MTVKHSRIEAPPYVEVWFTDDVRQDINTLCAVCPTEVGWVGLVEEIPLNNGGTAYQVYEIFVPTQQCSSTVTLIDPEATAKEVLKYLEDNNRHDEEFNLRYWGHSHVDMAVNPSPQDEKEFLEYYTKQSYPYVIRGIHNRKGDTNVSMFIRDSAGAWRFDSVPSFTIRDDREEREAKWKAILKERVTESVRDITHVMHGKPWGFNRYGGQYDEMGWFADEDDTDPNVATTSLTKKTVSNGDVKDDTVGDTAKKTYDELDVRHQLWRSRFPNWPYLTYPPKLGTDGVWDEADWTLEDWRKAEEVLQKRGLTSVFESSSPADWFARTDDYDDDNFLEDEDIEDIVVAKATEEEQQLYNNDC